MIKNESIFLHLIKPTILLNDDFINLCERKFKGTFKESKNVNTPLKLFLTVLCVALLVGGCLNSITDKSLYVWPT